MRIAKLLVLFISVITLCTSLSGCEADRQVFAQAQGEVTYVTKTVELQCVKFETTGSTPDTKVWHIRWLDDGGHVTVQNIKSTNPERDMYKGVELYYVYELTIRHGSDGSRKTMHIKGPSLK